MGLNILLPFEQTANPLVIAGDAKLVLYEILLHAEVDVCQGGRRHLPAARRLWHAGRRKHGGCSRCCRPASGIWCRWSCWTSRAATIGATLETFIQQAACGKSHGQPPVCNSTSGRIAWRRRWTRFSRLSAFTTACGLCHGKLVLRLSRRPSEAVLTTIQEQFADILSTGQFEITGQLPEEKRGDRGWRNCRDWFSTIIDTTKDGSGS